MYRFFVCLLVLFEPMCGTQIAKDSTAAEGHVIEQWAKSVLKFSSEWTKAGWKASQVLGEPNVYPKYGDISGAWAQETHDSNQFIELEFEEEVDLVSVEIYETYKAGGVVAVQAINQVGMHITLWESDSGATVIESARIFIPTLQTTIWPVKAIRLVVDCTAAATFVEIDAVKLIGKVVDPCKLLVEEYWVESVVEFSSEYETTRYAAANLIGIPDVYPKYEDNEWAWAQKTIDSKQYVVVQFPGVELGSIDIYETYNGGGVVAVKVLDNHNAWITLWESASGPTVVKTARIFTPPIKTPEFAAKVIRLDIDCTAAGSWVELDAIKIKSKPLYRPDCNCKEDEQGLDYYGSLSTTKKGYTCQWWTSQKPQKHDKNDPNKYPRAVFNEFNYCRNPDERPKGPWCFTTDPDVRSDYCYIPICRDPCIPYIRDQWVKSVVSYSSEWTNANWNADQVIGEANVYPRYGDIHGAWAQAVADDKQYIEVEFEYEVDVTSVDVYETINGGAVVAVKARSPDNDLVTLWESDSGPTVVGTTRIFSPPIKTPDFKVSVIRLDVDCTAAGTWAQIDAIRLYGQYSDPGSCDCKTTTEGLDYKGHVSKTKSGYTCQRWDSQTPWKQDKNDVTKYPNAINNEANYCRNPNERAGGPWCYTTDLNVKQEYCKIPMC